VDAFGAGVTATPALDDVFDLGACMGALVLVPVLAGVA
jgi:hypothetical protein